MSNVWNKLNLKDQNTILVVNAPPSFEAELEELGSIKIVRNCGKVKQIDFVLVFVTKLAEVERFSRQIATKAAGDALVWFAYPKQSSKNYRCEFNRDSGWQPLGQAGFEGVRQIAIDKDWSAIRFRRVEYIKNMTRDRSRAQTAQGKSRAKKTTGS